MREPTIQQIKDDHIKISVEHHHLQRILRAVEGKKNFLTTRCYSFDENLCKADNNKSCQLQCYDLEMKFMFEKREGEKLVKK